MVIELHFFKNNNNMKNMAKCKKHFLRYYAYLISQINQFLFHGYFSHILHLDMFNQLQIESENEKYPYMVFNGDRP